MLTILMERIHSKSGSYFESIRFSHCRTESSSKQIDSRSCFKSLHSVFSVHLNCLAISHHLKDWPF